MGYCKSHEDLRLKFSLVNRLKSLGESPRVANARNTLIYLDLPMCGLGKDYKYQKKADRENIPTT